MDYNQARIKMVESQVRTSNVLNESLLHQMITLPREKFVPKQFTDIACADTAVPIGHGQHLLSPSVTGRILENLALQPHETVYEIGTGTGYLSAIMSHFTQKVASIEILSALSHTAKLRLQDLKIDNVELIIGNGFRDFPTNTKFDVILVTGAVPFLPRRFETYLKPLGRIFSFVKTNENLATALLMERMLNGSWVKRELFETDVDDLMEFPRQDKFVF